MHADVVRRVHASVDAQCIAWVEVDHPGKHMQFRWHGGAKQFLDTAIRWLAVDGAALRLGLVVAASGRTLRFLADEFGSHGSERATYQCRWQVHNRYAAQLSCWRRNRQARPT